VCLIFPWTPAAAQSEVDDDTVVLTLDDSLRMALENNLQLVSARYTPEISRQDVTRSESNFDVNFRAEYDHSEQQSPPVALSTVSASQTERLDVAGIQQNLAFGGSYTAGFGIVRNAQDALNVFVPLQINSGFSFSFNMPILKGFGTTVTTEQLVLARGNRDISIHDLERDAELVIERVEGAYWDVVAAREALRIALLSLGRAEDLLELNQKKVEVGTLAPIEITQARAGVASQEEGVIVSQQTLEDAEDELLRLLAAPRDDPMWDKQILNGTRPTFRSMTIDVEAAIDEALSSRSELLAARQRLVNTELSEKVARRKVRHQLDLGLNYGPSGASLTFDDPVSGESNDASLGDSFSNIFEGDQYRWNATLTYSVPIGNHAARADFNRAKLVRRQSDVNLQDQEQSIRVEVRRTARAVDAGTKRVEAAQVNVELQREKLEAEEKKFANGMSTSFEVLTFQNDLADAELSEVRARLDYIKAVAAFERSKGTMLESRGLELVENP
jgi:outer membrane protein TolC